MMRTVRRRRSWKAPFLSDLGPAEIGQEILAGVMGWQTVVTSLEFYASLFVSGDDSDKHATAEIFMCIAGVSTIAFGLATNLPFIVAPSVLYAGRQTGITMGGQLAAQALANAAAVLVFWFALKLKLVSYIPTALRIGAGYGVAVLVGVLGMRNLGLLVADSFVLSTITWESVVGLAVITAASTATSPRLAVRKWVYVLGVPTALTAAVYAIADVAKFQGYALAENTPLSNWRGGSFGLVDFSVIFDDPGLYTFYVVRTFISIVINISSVLLVLIDTVCLQRFRGVVKSAEDTDYSDAIGGTAKFRLMACAVPLMSFLGNLLGVTTQAAFVQSMIVVFTGGKTGLSVVVTGILFILSMVMWPLLPVLVPAHISGALTIVITLRFFTAIRVIDVSHAENLLMFGVSILLIPFSFDFVDALCVATVLGFICTISNKIVSRGMCYKNSKVALSLSEENVTPEVKPPNETRQFTSTAGSTTKALSPIDDEKDTGKTKLPSIGGDHCPPGYPWPLGMPGVTGMPHPMIRHQSLPAIPVSWTATSQFKNEEDDIEVGGGRRRLSHLPDRVVRQNTRQSYGQAKDITTSELSTDVSHGDHSSIASTLKSISLSSSSRRSIIRGFRRVKVGSRSKILRTDKVQAVGKDGKTPGEIESENSPTVHWKLALVATVELVLKLVGDQRQQ